MAAFCAGFIDSIVGGGGLIQTPLSLAFLPNLPVSTVIGTLKIPAFSGTALATSQYLKKVKIDWKLFAIMAICAFVSAFLGSQLLTVINNDFMKPVLLIILIVLAIYTIFKKDFGSRKFPDQRFGQAFFNHFKLDQMDHRGRWDKLYNCENMLATIKMIRTNFEFTGATHVTTS